MRARRYYGLGSRGPTGADPEATIYACGRPAGDEDERMRRVVVGALAICGAAAIAPAASAAARNRGI